MSEQLPGESESRKPKLLEQMRRILRLKHYSIRTEKTYCDWARRFILLTH